MENPQKAGVHPENKERVDTPQLVLLKFLYDYYRVKCGIDLILPSIQQADNPSYRSGDHTIYLESVGISKDGILAIIEEGIHSLVAQFPQRKSSSQAINDAQANLRDKPLGRERQTDVIHGLRQQVTHYNTEEFLARYAMYHFLSDPNVIQKIIELYSISKDEIFEILRKAVLEGLRLEANHADVFSEAWFHAWGYLAASILFVGQSKIVAHTLFDTGSEEAERVAHFAIRNTKIYTSQLDEFTIRDGVVTAHIKPFDLIMKLSRFEISLGRHLDPATPNTFEITPGRFFLR